MKFSIVTTVLNGAGFIEATVRSVQGQSHSDWEYVIVDAGSTDGTRELLAELAQQDPRISVKDTPGAGMYRAILDALSAAGGDMLAWINADDLYTPWAFQRVDQFCQAHGAADWVTGLPAAWDAAGVLSFVRPQGAHPRRLIQAGWFHRDLLGFLQQESMFFSRTLFQTLSRAELDYLAKFELAGDYALWRRFARHSPLQTIPSVLGGFRMHGGNRSVTGAQTYMDEVRSDGAVFLPWPFVSIARRVYWRAAEKGARHGAAQEDARQSRMIVKTGKEGAT